MAFFPSVCMKNAEINFNFGEKSFAFPPVSTNYVNSTFIHSLKIKNLNKTNDYVGIAQASKENLIISQKSSGAINRGAIKREINAPLALIIEPSKELAEQTLKQIQIFKQYLKNPNVKEVLIGGKNLLFNTLIILKVF